MHQAGAAPHLEAGTASCSGRVCGGVQRANAGHGKPHGREATGQRTDASYCIWAQNEGSWLEGPLEGIGSLHPGPKVFGLWPYDHLKARAELPLRAARFCLLISGRASDPSPSTPLPTRRFIAVFTLHSETLLTGKLE